MPANDHDEPYWRMIATEYGATIGKMQKTLAALDQLVDDMRWGNAATSDVEYGRGVAFAIDKVAAILAVE